MFELLDEFRAKWVAAGLPLHSAQEPQGLAGFPPADVGGGSERRNSLYDPVTGELHAQMLRLRASPRNHPLLRHREPAFSVGSSSSLAHRVWNVRVHPDGSWLGTPPYEPEYLRATFAGWRRLGSAERQRVHRLAARGKLPDDPKVREAALRWAEVVSCGNLPLWQVLVALPLVPLDLLVGPQLPWLGSAERRARALLSARSGV